MKPVEDIPVAVQRLLKPEHRTVPMVSESTAALIEAHKALTHAQRLIDRALGRGK